MVPEVSVVIPVYNGLPYLETAIRSVVTQSFGNFELLLVDDGSTDGTPESITRFAAEDARIVALTKSNSGISDTLNLGLHASKGEWIARLDADDVMVPDRLERQLTFVRSNPDLVAAGSYYTLIDAGGRVRGTHTPLPRTPDELTQLLAAREPLSFTHPTMMFRRDAARSLGGYRKGFEPCEDADLFARMLQQGGLILIQPEVLTHYRVHGGSTSRRSAYAMFIRLRHVYHNFYAAREGRASVEFDEFLTALRCAPLRERLGLRRDYASELLYRAYTSAHVDGRRGLALACLGGAALLRPRKAIRRLLRAMKRHAGCPGPGGLRDRS